MNVEIMEFYPLERNDDRGILTGTLRVRLPDIGIQILGIFVSKKRQFWHLSLPIKQSTHHKTGAPVRYPTVVFDDDEKQSDLIAGIRTHGRTFVERWLMDANPQQQDCNDVADVKELVATADPRHDEAIKPEVKTEKRAVKQWMDPPPRKTTRARAFR